MRAKKLTALTTAIMAGVICCSAFTFASAAEADFSQTRYRFPIVKFELPVFKSGVTIDDAASPKRIGTDPKSKNGKDKLFLATVESYDHLGATNKALRVRSENSNLTIAENYQGFIFKPDATIGSSKSPLEGKPGISLTDNDQGVMLHISSWGLDGMNDPYRHIQPESAAGKKDGYTIDWQKRGFNFTLQETDFNDNGEPVKTTDDDGQPINQTSAYNSGTGNDVTLIWTRDFEYKHQVDGKEVIESGKVGQKVVVKSDKGNIELPMGFCGYVLIPASSLKTEEGWGGVDSNGKIDLKGIQLANLYMGMYPYQKGDMFIDDYAFYGSAFSDVKGAIDMGANLSIDTIATNKGTTVGSGNTPTDPSGGTNGTTSGGTTGGTSGGTSGGSANTGDNGIVWALWALFGASVITGAVVVLKKKKA